MSDPFENVEITDEDTATTETSKKENTSMTADSQNKIVVTLKGGAGYDAPWVVVHADDSAEALAILNDPSTKELLETTKKAGAHFAGTSQAKGGRQGQPSGSAQAPAGAPTPPAGYVYKSGMGKNGRMWYAFMGANRSDNLDPIWLNADGTPRG